MGGRLILALGLLLLLLPGCRAEKNPDSVAPAEQKIPVVATIYPLSDFARQVGGERVEVTQLLPPGVEPHGWEPTSKDMVSLSRARVFIYNGAGMEPWVERQIPNLVSKGVKVVEASRGLELITGVFDFEPQHGEPAREPGHPHEGHSHGGNVDPHVWLDPLQAQEIVRQIRDAFVAVDPSHASYYTDRAEAYIARLEELDREYREAARNFKRRDIVTSHAAFGYLARRYGLRQVPLMGLSPQSEPDPAHLRQVASFCREHNVKYIFFETLVSPKLSETLAREVGARTLVLNPIGNLTSEQVNKGEDYLSVMRQNLANLKIALGE